MHGHLNIHHDARSPEHSSRCTVAWTFITMHGHLNVKQTQYVCSETNEPVIKTTQYHGTPNTSTLNKSISNEMLLPSKNFQNFTHLPAFPLDFVSIYSHSKKQKTKILKKRVNLLTSHKFVNFTQILTQQLYNAIYCLITFWHLPKGSIPPVFTQCHAPTVSVTDNFGPNDISVLFNLTRDWKGPP